MPGTFGLDHDNTFTTLQNAQSITTGNSNDSSAVSLDGKLGMYVTVEVAYGATVNEGAKIFVLGLIDGSANYEARADNPWGFEMPKTASTTHRRKFWVPATMGDSIKIQVYNNSGATITVTVRYKLVAGVTA